MQAKIMAEMNKLAGSGTPRGGGGGGGGDGYGSRGPTGSAARHVPISNIF